MKVTLLKKNPNKYTCNAYLVRGDWNAIDDVNTLIDIGSDSYIIDEIETISTGVGKKRVEQVVLTHEHFDHSGGLKDIIKAYNPQRVIAYSMIKGVTEKARDGKWVRIGDRDAQILHTPGHSHDSICIYVPSEKVLFSGDMQLQIKTPGGSYTRDYFDILVRLERMNIQTIYSGHDDPITSGIKEILAQSIENILRSKII